MFFGLFCGCGLGVLLGCVYSVCCCGFVFGCGCGLFGSFRLVFGGGVFVCLGIIVVRCRYCWCGILLVFCCCCVVCFKLGCCV